MFISPVIAEVWFAYQSPVDSKRTEGHLAPDTTNLSSFIVNPVYSPQVAGVVPDEAPPICSSICPQASYTCTSETFRQAYSIKFQSIPSL